MNEEWPSPSVYAQAVQAPQLLADELRACTPRSGFLADLPLSFTGANAIVFPIDGPDGPGGLRFFTNRHAAQPGRYAALDRHRAHQDLPALARCRWIDDAIRLDGVTYPALLMEWIDGVLFDQYVLQLADTDATDALRALADDVWQLVSDLQAASLAHGDIQHGNLLVDRATGALRLVDFDSIWVPELVGSPPAEAGHPSYQHPERLSYSPWGPGVDTFAAMVLRLTLLAFAADPGLRTHAVPGSHLLLSDTDLKEAAAPGGMLDLLRSSRDAEVAATAAALIAVIEAPPDPGRLLDPTTPTGSATASDSSTGAGTGSDDDAGTTTGYWWAGAGAPVDDTTDGVVEDQPAIWEFSVPEMTSTDPSPTSSRPLPDIGRIAQRFESPAPGDTASPTNATSLSNWWGPTLKRVTESDATRTPPVQPPIVQVAPAHSARPSAFKRTTVAAIDVCMGLTLVYLPYLIYAASRGETPVKRSFDLAVVTTTGERATGGLLLAREAVSKHLPVWLLAAGGALSSWLAIVVAVVWVVVGFAPALGPTGRSLWDTAFGTTVVDTRTHQTIATGGTTQ